MEDTHPDVHLNSSMDKELWFTEPKSQAQNPGADMFQNSEFCRLHKHYMAHFTIQYMTSSLGSGAAPIIKYHFFNEMYVYSN